MENPVRVISSKLIYKGRTFDLVERELQYPNGKLFKRAIVEHSGAVVFIPQCQDGSLLLVRQYRAALSCTILEFPAGTLEQGEDPLECAKRESAEEVGHSAAEWLGLGAIYPSPGICSEVQHCYLARELATCQLEGDEDELIQVEKFSVKEVEDLILNGGLVDAKSLAIFTLARFKGFL